MWIQPIYIVKLIYHLLPKEFQTPSGFVDVLFIY